MSAGEGCLTGVEGNGRVTSGTGPTGKRLGGDPLLFQNVLATDQSGDGFPLVGSHRKVHQEPPVSCQQIALPACKNNAVSPAEQKPVSCFFQSLRIVAPNRIIEELKRPDVSAVSPIKENPPVSFFQLQRFENHKVGGVVN